MTYRARNITLALVLGLGAALLVTLYVHNSGSSSSSESLVKQLAGVFIAKSDIAAGTPGTELRRMIQVQQIPQDNVVPGAISDKAQVNGLVSTAPILAGQQVTLRQFRRVAQEGIAGEISRNRRAFQMAGDANQLLVGTLQKGDRIDVLANVKFSRSDFRGAGEASANDQGSLVASRVVLRNLLVLQAPEAPAGSGKFGASASFSMILRVTDNQAQKLFFVTKNSDWTLLLRPSHAASDSPGSAETPGSLLGDGLKSLQFFELLNGPQGPTTQ